MEGRMQNANMELTEREMLDKLAQTWESISSMQKVAYNGFTEIKAFLKDAKGTPCFDPEARVYADLAMAYASDNEFAAKYVADRLQQQLRGRNWTKTADPMIVVDLQGNKHDISHFVIELENLTAEMKLLFARALNIAQHNLERTFQNRLGQVRPAAPQAKPPEEVLINVKNKG